MTTLKAKYKGKQKPGFIPDEYYTIELNNNSNLIQSNNTKIPYRSLTDFLNDWDEIQHVKN